MLKLDLGQGPHWLDLGHGVRLKVLPLRTAVMVAARRDPAIEALPEDAAPDERGVALAKAVARAVVQDWEGVGDADGKPIPVSAEGIDALLDIWPLFEAFQERYLGRAMLLDAEKNASAPSPHGTSAGATATARPAKARARTARRG
jgi:hypothetical protein